MNRQFTILHVEDDPNDVLLVSRAFRKANFTGKMIVLNDGEQAIDYLKGKNGYADRVTYPLPSIMMMDLKLPRKSGLEVLSWVREQADLKRLPIVLLTSSKQPIDINQAYDNGANCYLLKPVNFDDLLQMVKMVDSFWLQWNQHPELLGKIDSASRHSAV